MYNKNIVIVGATSRIGESLIKLLSDNGNHLTLFAGSTDTGDVSYNNISINKIDYNDIDYLKEQILKTNPSVIINLSAMTDVDGCESNKMLTWHLNCFVPTELAKISSNINAHYIHISTDYVFDGSNGPYKETDQTNPLSTYGASKLLGEYYSFENWANTTIIRTNVVYGYSNRGKKDFVTWVIDKLRNNEPITVVDDQYSNPTLTDDIAIVISKIIDAKYFGLINVGGGEYCNRIDFVKNICKVFNLDYSLITPISTSSLKQIAKRPLKGGLEIYKLIREFNIIPHTTYDGLNILKGYMDENDNTKF